MTFKLGPGPLLRTCAEGEKQHVQMRASGVSVEFRSLEVGTWMRVCGWGLGPGWLEGVLEGSPSVEVGPWVRVQGWGLGSAWQEGGSEGRGLGPGAQQAPWCLSRQGKGWLCSLPFLHPPTPPHPTPISPRVSPVPAGPLTVGGSC